MNELEICEVGPRDGLQSEPRVWSAQERIDLINQLSETGVARIEAVSFVHPKRVPQMAEAETVMSGINRKDGVTYAGLALNARGVNRAIKAGVDEVRYVVVASDTFNQRNQGVSVDDTMSGYAEIAGKVTHSGLKLTGVVGAAFGCPFEGGVDPAQVTSLVKRLVNGGATEIALADTIGAAVPTQITDMLGRVRDVLGAGIGLGLHLHNTRNTGFANAAAAAMAGIDFLDASVGGIGGCPFAPRATGNIATEDLCYMLRNMGFNTGVDVAKLIGVSEWVETYFEAPLPGQIMKAGLFPETTAGA